jgi:hypothetical protein
MVAETLSRGWVAYVWSVVILDLRVCRQQSRFATWRVGQVRRLWKDCHQADDLFSNSGGQRRVVFGFNYED